MTRTQNRRTAERAITAAITKAAGNTLPERANVTCSLALGRVCVSWHGTQIVRWTDADAEVERQREAARTEVTTAMDRLTRALDRAGFSLESCMVQGATSPEGMNTHRYRGAVTLPL